MQGRKCLLAVISLLALSSCAQKTLLNPTCHDCAGEEQAWKKFPFQELQGAWKGQLETFYSDKDPTKKKRVEGSADLRFIASNNFLQTQGVSACAGLPENSVVLNGVLWEGAVKSAQKEFEAFAPAEEGKVSYGRIVMEKINGDTQCKFKRIGRVMGLSRLEMPVAHFSQGADGQIRSLASTAEPKKETEVSLEFMRFDVATSKPVEFSSARKPASVSLQEHPPLMLRVYKVVSQLDTTGDQPKSQWLSTEEHLYRLWKTK